MKKILIVVALVVVAAGFVIAGVVLKGRGGDETLRIAVIPKGTTHDFWNAVLAGARRAAEEEGGVEVTWTGPEREGDRERQIQIVEDFVVKRASGIVLAPGDSRALVPVVERATAAGIPVVIIDSGIETERIVSFVATDNYQGGAIAAKRMGEILKGRGRVAVVKYMAGSASTTAREQGFMETLAKEFPQIEIADHRYGMDTVETALSAAEDVLTRHQDLDGMFACNESTARGALRALESQGRAERVKLIGFDSSEPLLEGLRAGRIDSLVVQNPFRMGYDGVRMVVARVRGRPVERRIDTGVELVTAANLDSPEIQQLINPGRAPRAP
jgi:ribose transport system substrate-binding protein